MFFVFEGCVTATSNIFSYSYRYRKYLKTFILKKKSKHIVVFQEDMKPHPMLISVNLEVKLIIFHRSRNSLDKG